MVSIIITFYERFGHLKSCLDTLTYSSRDFDEVIIADDGSSEETVAMVKEAIPRYDFDIHHAWQPKDGFRAAAVRNNGIRHARGEYLIFLDCDFLVLPGAIRRHVEMARPKQFVAGLCKYTNEVQADNILQSGVSRKLIEDIYRILPEKPIRREHRRFVRYGILYRLGLVGIRKQKCSSFFSIHRKDLEAINGYDENFVGWGGEDEDLTLRMIKAGFRGKSVIPTARLLHLWHPNELGNRPWQEGSNVDYLYRKDIPFYCANGLKK